MYKNVPKYNKKQKPTLRMCALREKERDIGHIIHILPFT